jgi:hypothetical protein
MSKISPDITNILIGGDPCNQKKTSLKSITERHYEMVVKGYEHAKAIASPDPVDAVSQTFVDLNGKLKNEDPIFIAFWVEKYRTAHDVVKERVQELLGSNNVFFKDFNESMGTLANYKWTADRSTKHSADVNIEFSDIPWPYDSTHNYILDRRTKEVALNIYKMAGAVFNQNASNITEPKKMKEDGSTELWSNTQLCDGSHGGNLAVDHLHYGRMKDASAEILSIVEEDLKELSGAHKLLMNQKYDSEIKLEKIQKVVENEALHVTILEKEIKVHPDPIKSNDVLS